MQVTTLIRRATRGIASCAMLGACALALALPAPKDIEAAVSAGQFAKAETLLREVLQEKPHSARAHYELGQVLGREAKYAEALDEVQRAKAIDSTLKFAGSPEKFQQTLDKLSAAAALKPTATALTTPHAAAMAPAPAPANPGPALNLNYVLLGIGALVVVAFLIRRSRAAAPRPAMPYPAPVPHGGGPLGFGTQYAPNGPAYAPGYGPGYGAPAQGGSGIGGAVLGGVAGLAAGYALTKALEGEHHSNNNVVSESSPSGGYVPFDAPAAPDLGRFDGGQGDGWDSGDDASSDDNW
jgi:hypothetical protein